MRRQSIGIKIFLTIMLFFQAETSQARTVQNCANCTTKSCKDADDKEWCVSNCNLGQISGCLEVTPKINNEVDANRYGNVQRIELLNEIYKQFPLSKYFLDLKAPEEPERPKDGILNGEEKTQLKGALLKLEEGCQDIVMQLDYSKGRTLSAKDQMDTYDQMKTILLNVKTDFANFMQNLETFGPKQDIVLGNLNLSHLTSTSTRYEVKIAFDKANLNLKTCFNQGEGAIFKANQKERVINKVITKFDCALKCTPKKCKNPQTYNDCRERCPSYRIEACLEVGGS
jgi:hypothetical protein